MSNSTTYEMDDIKYENIQRSCGVLYFHFFWGLSMVILGWTTFAARWINAIKPYHKRMGQIWMYGMIILLYTSTYASYNGFRWFIFMFGVICYGGMIIGHSLIHRFQEKKNKQNQVIPAESPSGDVETSVPVPDIAQKENRFFTQQRLKTLHGIFMFASLFMVTGAGAAFTRRWSSNASCKSIYCNGDSEGELPECIIR